MKTMRSWVVGAMAAAITIVNIEFALASSWNESLYLKPKHRVHVTKKNKHKYYPHRHTRDKHAHKATYQSI